MVLGARAMLAMGFCVVCGVANAGSRLSGNDLIEYCQRTPETWGEGVCLGYVLAVADVMDNDGAIISGSRACFPELPNKQIIAVAKRWLAGHPELLHLSAHSLLAAAMAEAFPCSAQ